MRRIIVLLAAVAALAAPAALAKSSLPETIALPNGWQPEGIAIGKGSTFYVGSIPTGAVWVGDLRTGMGKVLVQGAAGHAATGLKYDHKRLFVSGASTGKAFVYDAETGALVQEFQLATGAGPTFVNDVVVTKDAAYFTDSNRAVIYKLPVTRNTLGTPQAIPLTGDFQLLPGFNLNGIDATHNGKKLITVQSPTGKLFTIDPQTGVTKAIDLGGATVTNGDGILLQGRTLYVVQNRNNQIAVIKLSHDLTSGTVTRTITDSDFDVPTTIGSYRKWLYAVNARFGITPDPTTPYSVVQVPRK
jgi:sugar lactone lactonase YvrE